MDILLRLLMILGGVGGAAGALLLVTGALMALVEQEAQA